MEGAFYERDGEKVFGSVTVTLKGKGILAVFLQIEAPSHIWMEESHWSVEDF